jgi:hypothetical protein
MTTQLIKYEAACRALAECKSVDEVKSWADKAAAMQAYGRMAKDKTLEVDAAEIRIRAERRLGEMLAATKADGGLNQGTRGQLAGKDETGDVLAVDTNDRQKVAPTLAQAGISKDLSSRAQKLAAVPEADFEAALAEKRERDRKEGSRVSAKLERAGAKVLQQQAELADDGPSAEEIAEARRAAEDDAETMRLLLESDDKLAAMTEKCRQQAALIRTLESRIAGLTNEAAQAVRLAKSWRMKYEKLEKASA